jgi:hypothetical protein
VSVQTTIRWEEANQRYLLAALALVRHALEEHCACLDGQDASETALEQLQHALNQAATAMPAPSALSTLCTAFGLSAFERDLLLLCAGLELDSSFRGLCVRASGVPATGSSVSAALPTFSLALAALPHAHWDALAPDAPLRRWRLISVGNGASLTLSPLRIDEAILHYLAGLPYRDERLNALSQAPRQEGELVPSHRRVSERLVATWAEMFDISHSTPLPVGHDASTLPIIQLCGPDSMGKSALAAHACRQMGLGLRMLSVEALPAGVSDLETLARLWEREAILTRSALLLNCDELDMAEKSLVRLACHFLQCVRSPLILTSRERGHLWSRAQRPVVTLDVRRPEVSEQRQIWQQALGALNVHLNGHIDRLAMQFNLNGADIYAASAQIVRQQALQANEEGIEDLLWDACRAQARPALEDLAQHIESQASWDNLVLPEAQVQLLHEIVIHVRQRATVYEAWGFARQGSRGLGISTLFAGSSGTGKTLAAEVLAHELRLDLYRIDLSSVVSKYIGETEKNLRRIFDAAEEGGAILLFDEADALFGKRSEVKDSHDRYANIEVSYLLQRMESYRGLAILTTNLKSSLDTAFLRRIRFIVHFPFPEAAMRAEIWRRIFPPALPTENLDMEKLARLHVAGGNIRNIALHAAFIAANAQEPVRMTHLLRAAATEYAKLEKPLTEAEIGGWIL